MTRKTLTPVKQHDRTDCAVACIAAIARYHGLALPLATIRQACGACDQGTTIKGIIDACESINMEATALKSKGKDPDAIGADCLPAILHVTNNEGDPHFIVVSEIGPSQATIMDPAEGKLKQIGLETLRKMWSGYLVTVKPGKDFKPGDSTVKPAVRLKRLFSLYGKQITASTLLSVLYILAGISFSLFLQFFIDKVIPSGDSSRIIWPAMAMAVLSVLALIIGNLRTNALLSAATGIDLKLISDYITHLFRLPVAFFNSRSAGEINSRISDAYTVRRFVTEGIPSVLISLITLLTAFFLMFLFHWKLAALMALSIPVYALIFYFASKAASRYNREIITGSTQFEKQCVESIAAVKSVKYACREAAASRALQARYMSLCEKMYKGGSCANRYSLGAELVSKFVTVILLSAGSLAILGGEISVGTLVSFYAITSFFAAPLAQIVSVSSLLTQTRISTQRLFEVLDLEEESGGGCSVPEGHKDLVFEGVTFAYPGSLNLLENFNARFEAGKITVIKGRSGCGKSSLAALAMRLYNPNKGIISLGGIDIALFDLAQWRKKITIVPQDVRLVDDTILYNITGEKKEYDLERVAMLLVELGLDTILQDLPMGIMSVVGEGGCRLSGGQKQRVAIAAALYRRTDILILDEATNSLDAASQAKMMQAIKRVNEQRGTTVIMITHKADEIPIADRIIDM